MAARLADGVWWLPLDGVNAYLVDDEDTMTLVDVGAPGDADALAAAIEDVLGSVQAVERVLVTHFDPDHVGGFGRVVGLDAPVVCGDPDATYLAGEAKPPWWRYKGFFQRLTSRRCHQPTGPIEVVAEGDHVGGFTAYHTPGHTSGHIVYVHEELSIAFLGDLVCTTNGGYTTPHWASNANRSTLRESIGTLVDRMQSFECAAPGHGRPIERDGHALLATFARDLG